MFAPHVSVDLGGLGLGMTDRAPVFEAAGRALFGPMAVNANAPDEGNVHLLEQVAVGSQRERFLAPLARGEQRSAFAMTEPAPGAGSDPTALRTEARREATRSSSTGRKKFITGADGAGFYIVMARTSGSPDGQVAPPCSSFRPTGPRSGSCGTCTPWTARLLGGHCEVELDAVRVPVEDVLGEVDEGFRYAQVRLGPAGSRT